MERNGNQTRFDARRKGWHREKFAMLAIAFMIITVVLTIIKHTYTLPPTLWLYDSEGKLMAVASGSVLYEAIGYVQIFSATCSVLCGMAVFVTRFLRDKDL